MSRNFDVWPDMPFESQLAQENLVPHQYMNNMDAVYELQYHEVCWLIVLFKGLVGITLFRMNLKTILFTSLV